MGDFIQGLGFDPYIDNDLSDQEFLEKIRLAGHRPIKAVLLDQSVIAGVGNWISDEVLYQTGIHPKTTSTSIEIQDASAILRTLKTIICEGIDRVSRGDELPPEWLFHYRFTRKHTQDYYGNTIKFDTIGGRSAAYVPKIQKRIDLARQTERIPEKKTGTRSMKRARVLRDLPSLESS